MCERHEALSLLSIADTWNANGTLSEVSTDSGGLARRNGDTRSDDSDNRLSELIIDDDNQLDAAGEFYSLFGVLGGSLIQVLSPRVFLDFSMKIHFLMFLDASGIILSRR